MWLLLPVLLLGWASVVGSLSVPLSPCLSALVLGWVSRVGSLSSPPSPCLSATLLLGWVSGVGSLSTCQVLDVGAYRGRRLEAIRGQILSKLQLSEAPDTDDLPDDIPLDLLLLYNSTRDQLREEAHRRQALCQRSSATLYYAQYMHRLDMVPAVFRDNMISASLYNPYFRLVNFDVSPLSRNVSQLVRAQLRLFRLRHQRAQAAEQRVEAYQVLKGRDPASPAHRYVESRVLRPRAAGEWVSFDLTQTVSEWLLHPDRNLGVKISVHCPCCTFVTASSSIVPNTTEELETRFAGIDDDPYREYRHDRLEQLAALRTPHLLITLLTPPHPTPHNHLRRKRATPEGTCSKTIEEECCLHHLYVDFRKDLDWKWIREPRGYKANFCGGPCPYLWSTDSLHGKILNLYSSRNPEASAAPCCVANDLDSLAVMYYVGRKPKVAKLSDMAVQSCKCR